MFGRWPDGIMLFLSDGSGTGEYSMAKTEAIELLSNAVMGMPCKHGRGPINLLSVLQLIKQVGYSSGKHR